MSTAARTGRRLLLKPAGPETESREVRHLHARALAVGSPCSPAATPGRHDSGAGSRTQRPGGGSRGEASRVGSPPRRRGSVGRPISIGKVSDSAAARRAWPCSTGGYGHSAPARCAASTPAASAPPRRPVRVPPNAAGLQSGVGALWSVDLNGGHVLRFDGPRLRRSRFAQVPARALATSDSGVWVARPTLTGGGTRISRLDPSTLRRTATVRVRFPVYQLFAAGGRVWMVDHASGRLVGLGGPEGRPVASERLGDQPSQVLSAGDWLWALMPTSRWGPASRVLRIDPRTGGRTGPALRVRGSVRALAAEGDRVWVVGAGWLRTFDIHTGRPLGRPVPIGRQPVDVERLSGRLWVVDEHEHSVGASARACRPGACSRLAARAQVGRAQSCLPPVFSSSSTGPTDTPRSMPLTMS